MSRNTTIALVVGALLLICCLCLVCAGAYYALQVASTNSTGAFSQIATELALTAGPLNLTSLPELSGTATPPPAPIINLTPIATPPPGASDTLETLQKTIVPINDLREVAMRLRGIKDIPETTGGGNNDWPLGQTLSFNATNTDTNQNFQVKARLIYKTDNVYFFADESTNVDPAEVKKLLDDFQQNVYPTDREFFGSEPNPGVDGDPHLYILFARGLGFSVAGYQSSKDEYSKLAQADSNEKEIYYINADTTSINDSSLRSVLAHEFQHMIHGFHDRNEDTWMNEGFSMLAEFLNGERNIGFDSSFTGNPDLQLNAWSEGGPGSDTVPHYGAAFLFLNYFLDRFGQDATKALVADQANGLQAVDDVLSKQTLTEDGKPLTAAGLFADWVIANYLDDASVGDGRYAYKNYPQMPKIAGPTETVSCPTQESATVHQFAADYIQIDCPGKHTLRFTGSQQIGVTPTDPHSGRYFFWSNRGDKSDTTLTREFDLSGVRSATLKFWTWYAIEKDYDYGYVEVSTDGGGTYTILKTPSCTTDNPSGNAFGCGYSDNSGGSDPSQWIQESVDLSAYAGQKVLVRFEYITDDAVNRNGWLIDDISLPELNYSEDFEKGAGGWDAQGFVQIDNALPQEYVVQVIQHGATTTVERLTLDNSNTGEMALNLAGGDSATLVVSGVTPFTTELASYQFEVK